MRVFDSKKPLVGFDVDGILLDQRSVYDAHREVARRLQGKYPDRGIAIPTDEALDFANRKFHSQLDVFGHHYSQVDPREAREIWYSIPHSPKPIPGAPETVRKMSEDGYPFFIATSRPQLKTQERLEEAGFPHEFFLFMVSTDGEEIQKPDPRVFTQLVNGRIAAFNERTHSSLALRGGFYVGDTPDDYKAAELARRQTGGPLCLVFPGGYYTREELLLFPRDLQLSEEGILGVPEEQVLNEIRELPYKLSAIALLG